MIAAVLPSHERTARVLVLSDYGGGESAATGGAGHAVAEHLEALRSAGIDAELIVGFGPDDAREDSRTTSLGGHDLRTGGVTGALRAIYNPASRTALERRLISVDPGSTLIILHQWTRYLSPSIAWVLRRFRTMVYMHDYFWACPNGAYFDFVRGTPCAERPLGAGCIARSCDRAGKVVKTGRLARQAVLSLGTRAGCQNRLILSLSAVAEQTANALLPSERHAVIHNPIQVGEYPAAPQDPQFDVGYFGRLEPEKGVGQLLAAAAGLGASSLFVGQGALEGAIGNATGSTHRSWQARDTIAATMRSCRVIALPSLWPETWGLIVPEAMAAGVPVLVSSRAGSSELVTRFGGGNVFDPGQEGDLSRALGSLLASPDPPALTENQWPAFREFLSHRVHAERIADLAARTWGLRITRDL